jgi:hypothetical protein
LETFARLQAILDKYEIQIFDQGKEAQLRAEEERAARLEEPVLGGSTGHASGRRGSSELRSASSRKSVRCGI